MFNIKKSFLFLLVTWTLTNIFTNNIYAFNEGDQLAHFVAPLTLGATMTPIAVTTYRLTGSRAATMAVPAGLAVLANVVHPALENAGHSTSAEVIECFDAFCCIGCTGKFIYDQAKRALQKRFAKKKAQTEQSPV